LTGDILWRRKESSVDENGVAPIPGTDLILLSFEKDSRTRIEAVDALSGDTIWQSEKLRGASCKWPWNQKRICCRRAGKRRERISA